MIASKTTFKINGMGMSANPNQLTYGLKRKYFRGENIFALETDRIFCRHWVCLGPLSPVVDSTDATTSDKFTTHSIGDYNVVVVRRADGGVSAFHNNCRHRGTRLIDQAQGVLKNQCITCPYHAWTYDLSGALVGAPNMLDQPSFDRDEHSLERVGCVVWCGFIMVHLTKTADDFTNAFAPITNRLAAWNLASPRPVRSLTYDVRANWKLLFQNYSECYHCPSVHPNLNQLTPYKTAKNDLTKGGILGGPMDLADGIETVSVDGCRVGDVFPGLNEEQKRSVYYYTIFPNMFVSAHPDYVMIHQLERTANDRSRVHCHFLAADGVPLESLDRAVQQWDEVNRQDWQVCEWTQKGVDSPAYRPGPYSSLESMLMAFDQYYRQAIASE